MTAADTRCHDADCRVREYCERWRLRGVGGTGVEHAATLRPAWQCWDEYCDDAIPSNGDEG